MPARPRWPRLALSLAFVCSALLALPSLSAPLFQDDLFHRTMLLDRAPELHWSPFELYEFVGGPGRPARLVRERGLVPWFTPDDLKLRFFRPLSSATLAFDMKLFGDRAWLARLHSLAWFLGIVGLVAVLHRRFLTSSTAALATLIYALSVGHAIPVFWIAARHTLVSTTFALLSVWCYMRWRDDGWDPGRWLAWLAFVAGLASGEMALGGLTLIGAWELAGRRDAFRRKLVALTPFALITLVYLGGYAALDYGSRGGGAYVGLDSGVSGALAVVRHFWILVGEVVAGTPSDAVSASNATAQTVAAFLGIAAALIAWRTYLMSSAHAEPRDRGACVWMTLAAAAAIVPGTLAMIGGRVLTLALVPGSAVTAVVLAAGFATMRDRARHPLTRATVAIAVSGFALLHFVAAPLLRAVVGLSLQRVARVQQEQFSNAPPCAGVMVLVVADDPSIAMYLPAALGLQGRSPERFRLLSMAAGDHRIERVTRTGFDLAAVGEAHDRTAWERLYRAAPLPAGTRVTMPMFDVTVIEDRAGTPVRTRFDFGEPLDSPHLCMVQWRDGRLSSMTPPLPGQVVDLPHQPGPMVQ